MFSLHLHCVVLCKCTSKLFYYFAWSYATSADSCMCAVPTSVSSRAIAPKRGFKIGLVYICVVLCCVSFILFYFIASLGATPRPLTVVCVLFRLLSVAVL